MRYMPKESLEIPVISLHDLFAPMQVKIKKSPKVAQSTLGVQNSQAHSRIGVSISTPGTPFHQNDHAVKPAPARKHTVPTVRRFFTVQRMWKRTK